jgi:hypothetical protein
MLHMWLISGMIGALLPLLFSNAAAQTLRPIRSSLQGVSAHAGSMKRDAGALELRDYETFLWGAEGKPQSHQPGFASGH